MSLFEHQLLVLRQELQATAQLAMTRSARKKKLKEEGKNHQKSTNSMCVAPTIMLSKRANSSVGFVSAVLFWELLLSIHFSSLDSFVSFFSIISIARGGVYSLEPLAVESELREVQLRSGQLQKKRKALLDTVDKMLRKDPFKMPTLPTTPRQQEKPLVKPNLATKVTAGRVETRNAKKSETLAECLAVLDSLQAEMSQTPVKVKEKEVSPETDDKKYLELIDLLTNKMFESEPTPKGTKTSKSNSLPRTGTNMPEARLPRSSSQIFSPSKVNTKPPGQLSAYERLFGVPSPSSSRCTSPVVKKGVPMIISKAKKGGSDRPSVLGKLGVERQTSRSEENVSTLPSSMANPSHEVKKKEKISLSSIDGLFSAPGKINIPDRYQPDQV